MTSIEWTDVTWNPVRGCTRVSEGCRSCYAERMAERFSGRGRPFHGFAQTQLLPGRKGGWTGRVELIPEKLDEPLRWRKPRRVFVNSMSDLFHEALPNEEIAAVLRICWTTWRQVASKSGEREEDHTYQILTKRAQRLPEFMRWLKAQPPGSGNHLLGQAWPLPNVWLGVSAEDQKTADERIPLLLQTPAAVRFVSLEPLLGPVDLRHLQPGDPPTEINALAGTHGVIRPHRGECARLDWVIVGGESGPVARPCDVAWVRSIVRQCREAGVPCFVKQLGARPFADESTSFGDWLTLNVKSPKGGDPAEWPEDLRVRQFPDAR